MSKLDLLNKTFNRWTVISEANKIYYANGTAIQWNCLCICGGMAIVKTSDLVLGKSKSCGCLRTDEMRKRESCHGHLGTSEYFAWASMKDRCSNSNFEWFKNWGGRGITVCDRWLESFKNFLEDMGYKPTPLHSLDRINTNGNYEPSNCRWATKAQQNRNKRNNVYYEYNGIRMVLIDWARLFKISHTALSRYVKKYGVDLAMVRYYERLGQLDI